MTHTFFSDDILLVSNKPESIQSPGLVFDEVMLKSGLRVLYHHKNVADYPLFMTVLITNPEDVSVDITFFQGHAGPSTDVVFAGHKAGKLFFQDMLDGGRVMRLPPHSVTRLMMYPFKPGMTSSGIFRVATSTTVPLKVKMMFVDEHYGYLTGLPDLPDPQNVFRVGVFEESYRSIHYDFDGRQKIGMVTVGGPPYMKDYSSGMEIKGNYGMMYNVRMTLRNSEQESKRLRLFVEPSKENGVDRALVYLNGELKDVGLMRFANGVRMSEKIAEFELAQGEETSLSWMTFPQSGCFYPVNYVIQVVEH